MFVKTSHRENFTFIAPAKVFFMYETNITYLKGNAEIILAHGAFYKSIKHSYCTPFVSMKLIQVIICE